MCNLDVILKIPLPPLLIITTKKKKTWMIKYLRKIFQCFMCFKKLKYICLKIDLFLKGQELLNR